MPANALAHTVIGRDRRLRFLLATAETHPTHRADVRVLFGKYAPMFGVDTDLLAPCPANEPPPWGGGRLLAARFHSKPGLALADLAQQISLLWRCTRRYDGLIVRDKPFLGAIGLAAARLARIPFVYWMSFPMPEAYLEISRTVDGTVGWPRRVYARLRGLGGTWVLYRLLVPFADFVFVQSPVMVDELRIKGLSHSRVLPVPMGVDIEGMHAASDEKSPDPPENGKSAVYLGTLSLLRRRELELMIDAAKIVGAAHPEFVLWVIGESDTESEKGWLQRYAHARGADRWVRFFGWVPYDEGLSLARKCSIGLSPFPRGELFESASPTKAIEYLALGLPVVCNDQPDQERVIRESGAGVCADLTPEGFASSIMYLLDDPEQARLMGSRGRAWVERNRSYRHLAATVTDVLSSLGCRQR